MSKEFAFYEKDDHRFITKFYRLMDLLITNKSTSRLEAILLISISYLQLIAGFFSDKIGIFKLSSQVPDNYLTIFHNIIRVKNLLSSDFSLYSIIMYLCFSGLMLLTVFFLIRVYLIRKVTFYSYLEMLINIVLKLFLYVLFNPLMDLCLSIICFGASNPTFPEESCEISDANKLGLLIICIVMFFYTIFLALFFSFFYNDSFLLSNSYFARISCNYEVYMMINSVIFSILLSFVNYLDRLVFMIYNLIISFFLLRFFFERYPFYDHITNFLIGWFHVIYLWTSIFSLIFAYFPINQPSIIYIVGIFLLLVLHFNFRESIDEKIVLVTPFHKLNNKNYVLYYIRALLNKIHNADSFIENRAELIGIVQLHKIECPEAECATKTGVRLYLPMTEEWSYRRAHDFNDKVFLTNFIIFIIDFFIFQNFYSPDLLMNFSLYYLHVMGNHFAALYYCQKVMEMNMTKEERFLHFRTSQLISKTLVEKLKPSNEICENLEELNTTMFFKYENLCEKFFEEISSEISVSLEFWSLLKRYRQKHQRLDFNQIFSLTDRVRLSKNKIEHVWNELFNTYNGCNELFELYECYVEYINDDDILTRELQAIRTRLNLLNDNVEVNHYNTLFSKDTGVIIASGNKGKEGMIEKVSDIIPEIFKYGEEEMKGMNVSYLMPRIFEKEHKKFMQRVINIGEKRVLDRTVVVYGKDKMQRIIVLSVCIKLFPMLQESTYFCAIINKESIDDVILLDGEFNIQGMSPKLMTSLKMNESIFQDCEVPFWLICRKFISHYQTFMADNPYVKRGALNRSMKRISSSAHNLPIPNDDESKMTLGQSVPSINDIKLAEGTEMNFEINENADVEWEIIIPPFFKLYVSNDEKQENFLNWTMGIQQSNSYSENIEDENGIIYEKSKESDDNYEEDAGFIQDQNDNDTDMSKNGMKGYTSKAHEKEFQNVIGKYRPFFSSSNTNNYTELIQIIDKLNEGTDNAHKFFISFRQMKYGDGKIAYVVRCIDKEPDNDVSSCEKREEEEEEKLETDEHKPKKRFTMNHKEEEKNKLDKHLQHDSEKVFQRRRYLSGLASLEETTPEDIEMFNMEIRDYHRLTMEAEPYMTNLNSYREEIAVSSRVLGKKYEIGIDDTSSQSSSATQFLQDLSKKARVQEVKAKIMTNVKDFYTINCIKLLFLAYIPLSVLFSFLYIFRFREFSQDAMLLNQLHSGSILNLLYYSNVIGTLTSLRVLNQIMLDDSTSNSKNNLTFSTYTSNNNISSPKSYIEYFTAQRHISTTLSQEILSMISFMEYNFTKSIKDMNDQQRVWNHVDSGISFPGVYLNQSKMSVTMAIANSLIDVNDILNSENLNFIIHKENSSNPMIFKKLSYMLHNTIENSYSTILPWLFSLHESINSICSTDNSTNINQIFVVILLYLVFVVLFVFCYMCSLYLTNKNMEDGLLTVSKIDLEYIEDIMKQIETFNISVLSRFRGKGNEVKTLENMEKDLIDKAKTGASGLSEDETGSQVAQNNSEGIDFDSQPHKRLKILNLSYFQTIALLGILCAFLIPIYFKSTNVVFNTNLFLQLKTFFYSDLISFTVDSLNLKMEISGSGISKSKYIRYSYSLDEAIRQELIDQLNFYPELADFYKNKYILDLCAILYDIGCASYLTCSQDPLIKTNRNPLQLLKSMNDEIFSIHKDIEMKIKSSYDKFNTLSEFSNENFKVIEQANYRYLLKIPKALEECFTKSLIAYLDTVLREITLLSILLAISMMVFSLYVIFLYINRLIHLLLISRCIFKIVPTHIINKTKEMEDWIENKY